MNVHPKVTDVPAATVDGHLVLWRGQERGPGRGLLLCVDVCPIPGCADRSVIVEGHLFAEGSTPATVEGTASAAALPEPIRPTFAFTAVVDVDDGEVRAESVRAPEAIAWLEQALDRALLDRFRRRFQRERARVDASSPFFFPEAAAPRADTPRVGRNDPCPCGSGRKYKRCCLTDA